MSMNIELHNLTSPRNKQSDLYYVAQFEVHEIMTKLLISICEKSFNLVQGQAIIVTEAFSKVLQSIKLSPVHCD